jgi:hypothetical protein
MGMIVFWFPARAVQARSFSGSQHGRTVAWRMSVALLQPKEEEEDRGEKRRREEKRIEILIGADKIMIFFFLLRLSRVFKQEVLSLVFFRWRC